MTKKMLLSLLIGASVLVTAACGNTDDNTKEEEPTEQEQTTEDKEETAEQPEMPEPDLADVPDVVAEVNGDEISKEEFEPAYMQQFQQMAVQAQVSGQEVDEAQLKEQIAESLVSQRLLVQETEDSNIEATDEEVNETLTALAEQNGIATSEEFLVALEDQGLSKEEVMEQVASQVKVDKLIAEKSGDIKVSEEELQEFYERMIAQQKDMGGEELPPLEDIKSEVETQIMQQKENEAVQALVTELREDADVTIYIK